MDNDYKEAKFDVYCKFCQYSDREERMDPCNECLETGMNHGSAKPVCFKEREDT